MPDWTVSPPPASPGDGKFWMKTETIETSPASQRRIPLSTLKKILFHVKIFTCLSSGFHPFNQEAFGFKFDWKYESSSLSTARFLGTGTSVRRRGLGVSLRDGGGGGVRVFVFLSLGEDVCVGSILTDCKNWRGRDGYTIFFRKSFILYTVLWRCSVMTSSILIKKKKKNYHSS